jgi:uncharacterized tellurite resistance protein B-like protein
MFNFFKKKAQPIDETKNNFEVELTASILAYEIARSDGDISESELSLLYDEIKKISAKVGKKEEKILEILEEYSKNSVSFYEFINDINKDYSKEDKLSLIQFLYDVAYADKILEVSEERLIRRIADLIKIKDIEVLKIKSDQHIHHINHPQHM